MRLRLISRDELQPGARIDGETLLRRRPRATRSTTWKGSRSTPAPGGEIIVTMISDDNFNHVLQRTLLLQFASMAATWRARIRAHRAGDQLDREDVSFAEP